MTKQHKMSYIRPTAKTINIELEQHLLADSQPGKVEDLGEEKEEIEWARRRKAYGGIWNSNK